MPKPIVKEHHESPLRIAAEAPRRQPQPKPGSTPGAPKLQDSGEIGTCDYCGAHGVKVQKIDHGTWTSLICKNH